MLKQHKETKAIPESFTKLMKLDRTHLLKNENREGPTVYVFTVGKTTTNCQSVLNANFPSILSLTVQSHDILNLQW